MNKPIGGWLENELAPSVSLDGPWQFSLAGSPTREIPVPSAWEAHTSDKLSDGPAHFQRTFSLPAEWRPGQRTVLEFGAVSFDCRVLINGLEAGGHTGMWSPFQIDITAFVQPGENKIELVVWKCGRRFPPRENLAGFLPDVATTFGGIWQSARLFWFEAAVAGLRCVAQPGNVLLVIGGVAGSAATEPIEIQVEVSDSNGRVLLSTREAALGSGNDYGMQLDTSGQPRWSPAAPSLSTVTITAWQGGGAIARARRVMGWRDVAVSGAQARIDGRPLQLRGVLDWGWQPQIIRPAPDRGIVLRQFEQARALGFNLVKLCLFVPDEATFQAADEAGMYLWLEMPLWLPHLTPAARAQAAYEYGQVYRRLRHHPSIVVLSLGCELNAEADAEFLQSLAAEARHYFPNTLLCDNSGSAEAYGGVATALSDFNDYHFYTDPHFFAGLVDHFDRPYRPARPWLFGEFCDADTGRDFSALQPEPWWLLEPVALDRDDFLSTRDYHQRLPAAGVNDGGQALTRIARKQATAVRKFILEQARLHDATGGYVISGWSDTPITTSGIVDDQGELKFDPAEWQRFNAEAVLLLERERRRRWVAGGDRPAYRDPFSWWADERPELDILLSNGLGASSGGKLTWIISDESGASLEQGGVVIEALRGGEIVELTALRPTPPAARLRRPVTRKLSAVLDLTLLDGTSARAQNEWPLWVVPRPHLPQRLAAASGLREQLSSEQVGRGQQSKWVSLEEAGRSGRLLTEAMSPEMLEWVAAGGHALWWITQPDPGFTRGRPFWREAIHVFEPHPLWEAAPQAGFADMRFFSVATDLALDLAGLQARLGSQAICRPLWRRFDARSLEWGEYVIEVQYGAGHLFVSSLRLAGGLGRQPEGLEANPWGAWLLASLLNL